MFVNTTLVFGCTSVRCVLAHMNAMISLDIVSLLLYPLYLNVKPRDCGHCVLCLQLQITHFALFNNIIVFFPVIVDNSAKKD